MTSLETPPSSGPLRVGVVGVGTIARAVHLPLLARHPDVELVAVSDLDPQRAAEVARAHGARVLDLPALLAAPDVDALLVATPGGHARIAVDALRAGKHVLAEKPLALTRADAAEAGRLAGETGLVLQVGYMKAHDAAVPVVREALRGIGEVRLVQVGVRHPADGPQLQHLRRSPPGPLPGEAAEQARRADAADAERVVRAVGELPAAWHRLYRSVLCGSVLHELSLLRALGLGLPTAFDDARLDAWDGSPTPLDLAPPTLTASARLAGGARLLLDWAWLPDYPEYEESVRIAGTAGGVTLDVAPPYVLDARSSVEVVTREGVDGGGGPVRRRAVLGHDGAFQRQLEAFVASVRAETAGPDAPAVTDAAGAQEDLRCLQALLALLAGQAGLSVGGEAAG